MTDPPVTRSAGPPVRPRGLSWLAALLALLAIGALVAVWASGQPQVQTTTIVSTPAPAGISVTDCPPTVTCTVEAARDDVVDAARLAFPRATAVEAWRVVGADAQVYVEHTEIVLPERPSIGVTARCLLDDADIADRTAGNSAGTSAPVSIVVGGVPGCSVAVSMTTAISPADIAAATTLAQQPVLQLPRLLRR